MRAAERLGDQDAHEHPKRPSGGDDDPATAVSLGARQEHVGHDAVAEDDEHGGSDEFGEGCIHDG